MMTTSMTKQNFQSFYSNLSKDTSLMRTLVAMQTGVTERKAYETAEAIIRDVAAAEGTLASLQEDTLAVVDSFLSESPMLQGDSRMEQLHRLHFGLKLHDDADLVEAMKEGKSRSDLFAQYYDAAQQDETVTEETLTADIRQQLLSLAASPEIMTAIVHKLEGTNGMLPNAAAVSADGQRFQCILAMQLYLSNRGDGMTTTEAAAMACSAVEVQAIADAAGRGLLTRDQVVHAIEIIGALIVLFGFLCHFGFFTGMVAKLIAVSGATLAANSGTILFIGYAVMLIADALGALAGKLSATYHFTHAAEHAEMMAGLRSMADALKAKAEELKDKVVAKAASLRPAVKQEEVIFEEDADTACAF